ncbi:MAG: c-type cytochrome [Gemmatimonadetes bacterium]|nr:c-type cytochrome [Gemmatimonadota bacterium]
MASVDLKVGGVILTTIGFYTLVANIIPQVQSEVPEVLAFSANVSPEELVAAGDGLFNGAGGCTACHAESPGARAPNLLTDYRGQGTIGARCDTRVPGTTCKEYLYQSLITPMAHVVDEYAPIMPEVGRVMTPAQVWSLVAFLESNGGEITVTGADIPPEAPRGAGGAVVAAGGGMMVTGTDPAEIVGQNCMTCHQVGTTGVPLGPRLNGVGTRLTPEQLRQSILDPAAAASPGFEALIQTMPKDWGNRLTATQLESVVGYLSALP